MVSNVTRQVPCSGTDNDLEVCAYDLNDLNAAEQRLKDLIHERLQSRCEYDPETDCWIYTGSWDSRGLAKIRVGARSYTVSRVAAWLYLEGFELWDSRWVYHSEKCPNLACFNYEHLRLADGRADAMARLRGMGRMCATGGSSRAGSRLSWEKVRSIRSRLAAGESPRVLAREHGLRRTYSVTLIARNQTWRQAA